MSIFGIKRESVADIKRKQAVESLKLRKAQEKHQREIEKLHRKTEKAQSEAHLAQARLHRRQARGAYFAPLPMFKAPKVSSVKKVAKKAGSTKRRIGIF